ncbi:MAG TPA: UvrD-helicase domain-containing protein [Candidatus Marinimicrobia bacterium]|jgi:DNA helicase-2/ATP-dependent DNA helicase PcrA|nr:UvrD-helicase domain-containing protein [Candidatus Neomarinimicrobiota bacterium]|tara:strand:+ start:3431 stop:5608 length:2178 start_codon:yes stop_codon:yes gene_type:complete
MDLTQLNKTQQDAVKSVDGPVLVFAGAGSGKTRVLTYKISYLINKNIVKPENILAMTFTNKAAGEMKSRVKSLLNDSQLSISIGTFHSICARFLRDQIHHIGFSSQYNIYDTKDQKDLIKFILTERGVIREYSSPKEVLGKISYYKNKLIFPNEARKNIKTQKESKIIDIYEAYQYALKDNDALDFDDLIIFPLVIFEKYPKVLNAYRKKWEYVLVDEYQDTNIPQFKFVTAIAEKHKQICVVGDDDQSIYGWRGAEVRNILEFEKLFPGCKIYQLETNYRSTQEIVNAAIQVVQNNNHRKKKVLHANNGSGEKLGLFETIDELEESDAVVSAIGKEVKLNKRRFNEFGILYRTNAQSRSLEDSLRRNGIPYIIIGGIRFYERKEIKNILSYIKLIVNPKDMVSLKRIVNFPPRGIGLKTIAKCQTLADKKKCPLFDVFPNLSELDLRNKQVSSLKHFHNLIVKYRDLLDKLSPNEFIRALVEEAGIIQYYKSSEMPEDAERLQNTRELLNSIDDFVNKDTDSDLNDFLAEVSLLTNLDKWNDEDNRVSLMTLHSSKGLEFPVIFITGLEDGLFPLSRTFNMPKELEEERRLFYVGITRAMEKVYLLYATNRRKIGIDYNVGFASRFLTEIPEEYLEKIPFRSALMHKVSKKRGKSTQLKSKRSITTFDDFTVGDFVEHAVFGVGKIMALSGTGENQRVAVVFKGGMKKKLIVKFANLIKTEQKI